MKHPTFFIKSNVKNIYFSNRPLVHLSISAPRLAQLLAGNPRPFVLYYSFGSALSICSSFFLSGPWKQVKKMFAPVRVVATVVYLITLSLTLFVALSPYARMPGRGVLLLLLVIAQFVAYVWYSLSYIPFARSFFGGFWAGLRSA